jgi:signal peptidase II
MTIGQEFPVFGNWFIIHFTENEGMAFGLTFGGEYGKLALSLFRLVAIIAIGWYLYDLIRKKMPFGFLLSIALILAGAMGNLIDSAFYGMIFSRSSFHTVAELFPDAGGYSSFLHGKVVDMFYFPVIQTTYPEWFPFWGGNRFIFFRPVFNIADSSITIGVFTLLLFYRKHFAEANPIDENQENPVSDDLVDSVAYQPEETEEQQLQEETEALNEKSDQPKDKPVI